MIIISEVQEKFIVWFKDAKLTINNVNSIYIGLINGIKPSVLAKKYSVTYSTICKIRDKKSWKIITDQIDSYFAKKGILFNDYPIGSITIIDQQE